MRLLPVAFLFWVCGLWLTACASPIDSDRYADWVDQDPSAWQVGGRVDGQVGGQVGGQTRSWATEYRADTLRLVMEADTLPDDVEALVSLAMERNPGLRAAQHRVQRLRERGPQVTALDDPVLRVTPFGKMAETATGQVRWMAGVSQRLPYPGKRDARGEIAEHDAAMAEHALAAMRLEIAAGVRRAYWSYGDALRAGNTVERDRALLHQFREVAQAKYRAGTAEQQDVLRASVELANLERKLLQLQQQRQSAAAMLNRLLDRAVDAPLPQPPEVATAEALAWSFDLDQLLAAAASHPQLARLREQAARYRQQRRLANLNRSPDLTVSLNYAQVDDGGRSAVANGDDQWAVGLGINLPLWQNKNNAAEREALAGLMETAALIADEQNHLAFRVQDAFARVQTQRDAVALFETQMLPEARQAVEAAESSYRAGRGDFLTLIDNWRRLTELQLMHVRAFTQLQKDLADLRLAAALPVTRDSENAPPRPLATPPPGGPDHAP